MKTLRDIVDATYDLDYINSLDNTEMIEVVSFALVQMQEDSPVEIVTPDPGVTLVEYTAEWEAKQHDAFLKWRAIDDSPSSWDAWLACSHHSNVTIANLEKINQELADKLMILKGIK